MSVPSGVDREYARQACRILMECLHLLAFGLRAVVVAKWEECKPRTMCCADLHLQLLLLLR